MGQENLESAQECLRNREFMHEERYREIEVNLEEVQLLVIEESSRVQKREKIEGE
jgi:hypothetical protein